MATSKEEQRLGVTQSGSLKEEKRLGAPQSGSLKEEKRLSVNQSRFSKEEKQLSRSISHMLKRAAQFATHLYMGEAGKMGLTQRQFTVLSATNIHDNKSQIDLVKITGIDRSTLADLVARLIAQGYLQRSRSREDGRTNVICITAAGKKILKAAKPRAEEVDRQLLSYLTTTDRKHFSDCLNLLASQMDDVEKKNPCRLTPTKNKIKLRA